jgi:hypothetical protein
MTVYIAMGAVVHRLVTAMVIAVHHPFYPEVEDFRGVGVVPPPPCPVTTASQTSN